MTKALAAVLVIGFALSPPIPDDCYQTLHPRANPGLCYPGPIGPLPGSGGGGPGDGGLIGSIGRILHGLTGGLL
jgi:hypothetical protein